MRAATSPRNWGKSYYCSFYIELLVVVVDNGDMWALPLKRNQHVTCRHHTMLARCWDCWRFADSATPFPTNRTSLAVSHFTLLATVRTVPAAPFPRVL